MAATKTIDLQAFFDLLAQAGVDVPGLLERLKAELAQEYPDAQHIPLTQLKAIIAGALTTANVMKVVGLVAVGIPNFLKTGKSRVKRRGTRLA